MKLIFLTLALFANSASAAVEVHGTNDSTTAALNASWAYIRTLVGIDVDPAPVVYVYSFTDPSRPELLRSLQTKMIARIPELKDDPEKASRFLEALGGITYEEDLLPLRSPLRGRIIQINPKRSFDIESGGTRGYGLYLTAHEMLHYALNRRGVPGKYQHCLMIEENDSGDSLMLKVARDLTAHGWANETLAYKVPWAKGYAEEGAHCGADAAEIQRDEGAVGLKQYWIDVSKWREAFL